MVLLLTHPDGFGHVTPPGHPERVARLEAVVEALDRDLPDLLRAEAPLATREDLLLCHPADYIDAIEAAIPDEGYRSLDGDTHVSPGSLKAALRAVGANIAAVDAVLSGEVSRAFCAVRPPGHHAERTTAMGFCLFGSAAIGAMHALERHGLSKVAIVDFDVHHGNGTQDLVWNEPRVAFHSSHQMPLYPGTGTEAETGASGNVFNYPLPPGAGSSAFRKLYEREVFPALEEAPPDLLIISAGFDAHKADPLANLELTEEDFAWVTRKLVGIAERHCEGRVVSTLEGGYDLEALAASTVAHVRALGETA